MLFRMFPTYGNYGGPGWSANEWGGDPLADDAPPPIDELDAMFQIHDAEYAKATSNDDIYKSDMRLAKSLAHFVADPLTSLQQPKSYAYAVPALALFAAKLLLHAGGATGLSSVSFPDSGVDKPLSNQALLKELSSSYLNGAVSRVETNPQDDPYMKRARARHNRRRIVEQLLMMAGLEPNPGPRTRATRQSINNAARHAHAMNRNMSNALTHLSAIEGISSNICADDDMKTALVHARQQLLAAIGPLMSLDALFTAMQARQDSKASIGDSNIAGINKLMASLMRTASEWVPDLTTEGIEPNPGPVPTEEISMKLDAALEQAMDIVAAPMMSQDGANDEQQSAFSNLFPTAEITGTDFHVGFIQIGSDIITGTGTSMVYNLNTSTYVATYVANSTYNAKVATFATKDIDRRFVTPNGWVGEMVLAATRNGATSTAMTSLTQSLRVQTDVYDGATAQAFFSRYLGRTTQSPDNSGMRIGAASKQLYVAAALCQASHYLDPNALQDNVNNIYPRDFSTSDTVWTPVEASARNFTPPTCDPRFPMWPFSPEVRTAAIASSVRAKVITMKTFMQQAIGRGAAPEAGWGPSNYQDTNFCIVPVLSTSGMEIPSFMTAKIAAYARWPAVLVDRQIGIMGAGGTIWNQSTGPAVELESGYRPNAFTRVIPGPMGGALVPLKVLFVLVDTGSRTDIEWSPSSTLNVGSLAGSASLVVGALAADIGEEFYGFFTSGRSMSIGGQLLWTESMTYLASKDDFDDFIMAWCGATPVVTKPMYKSLTVEGGREWANPVDLATWSLDRFISVNTLASEAQYITNWQGDTTPLGPAVTGYYSTSPLTVAGNKAFTMPNVHVWADIALLNNWILIVNAVTLDKSKSVMTPMKASYLQHVVGTKIARCVDALSEWTGMPLDLYTRPDNLGTDNGCTRLARQKFFANKFFTRYGFVPNADGPISMSDIWYTITSATLTTFDKLISAVRTPWWVDFPAYMPLGNRVNFPEFDVRPVVLSSTSDPNGLRWRFQDEKGRYLPAHERQARLLTAVQNGYTTTGSSFVIGTYDGAKTNALTSAFKVANISTLTTQLWEWPTVSASDHVYGTPLFNLPQQITYTWLGSAAVRSLYIWSPQALASYRGVDYPLSARAVGVYTPQIPKQMLSSIIGAPGRPGILDFFDDLGDNEHGAAHSSVQSFPTTEGKE